MDNDEQLTVELVLKALVETHRVMDDIGANKGEIISCVAEILRDVVHVEDYENQASTDKDFLLARQTKRLIQWENEHLRLVVQYAELKLHHETDIEIIKAADKFEHEIRSIIGDMHSCDDAVSCAVVWLENAIAEFDGDRIAAYEPKKRTNFEFMPELRIEASDE